ncbi:Mbeg1-like protein [Pandoraea sp. ISTKB]|uniref:Mbeg1-like protein n=1 Tax=Pandoraea sp. ISTKB TaxID=1586708 RepID=UPI001481CE87|nr:Mbeg1-like protein [Pandoraea sp. ISTKB]
MPISIGALSPMLYPCVFPSLATHEPPSPATDAPTDASRTVDDDTTGHWNELATERRLAGDEWRRTLQLTGTLPRAEATPSPDSPHPLDDRLLTLTRIWRDAVSASEATTATREGPRVEFDSPSKSNCQQQATAYRNVLAQMTPLIGADAAHNSAREMSKLVPIARRVDEIDAWIEKKGLRNTPPDLLEQRNVMAAALVNQDVYFDEAVPHILPGCLHRLRNVDHNGPQQSGYFGAIYTDALGDKVIVANRGTEMGITERSGIDWKQNIRQAFGLSSSQYTEAIHLARSMALHHSPSKLVFTGHSLGGGLASAQTSVVPGSNGLTFDAAGLHNRTVARHCATPASTRVKAYHVNGEALSMAQEALKNAESLATRIPLFGRAMSWVARMTLPHPVGARIGIPLVTSARHEPVRDADNTATDHAPPAIGPLGAIQKHSMVQMTLSLSYRLPRQRLSRDDTLAFRGAAT